MAYARYIADQLLRLYTGVHTQHLEFGGISVLYIIVSDLLHIDIAIIIVIFGETSGCESVLRPVITRLLTLM